jgi:CspA family cold shock protein
MPKPRSYDDCLATLERGIRDVALQLVRSVFDAELARFEVALSGTDPAELAEPTPTPRRTRSRAGSPAPIISSRSQRRRAHGEPRAKVVLRSADTSASSAGPPPAGDAGADEATQPLLDVPDGSSVHVEQPVASEDEPASISVTNAPDAHVIARSEHPGSLELGTVKWFSDEKGYGFIAGDDGDDVFVHRSSLAASGLRTLRDGQRVLYVEEKGAKGPVATRVGAS